MTRTATTPARSGIVAWSPTAGPLHAGDFVIYAGSLELLRGVPMEVHPHRNHPSHGCLYLRTPTGSTLRCRPESVRAMTPADTARVLGDAPATAPAPVGALLDLADAAGQPTLF